jgi:hypothetical protein
MKAGAVGVAAMMGRFDQLDDSPLAVGFLAVKLP